VPDPDPQNVVPTLKIHDRVPDPNDPRI